MSVPSVSSNPLGYVGIDTTITPQVISAQRAPTANDIYPPGWEWCDRSQNPFNLYITQGQGNWTAGNPQATTSVAGVTRYATNAEAAAHVVSNAAITPSNLPSILASPTAIGSVSAAAGTFTAVTATSGNIAASSGSVSAGTTVTAGTGITASTGNISATNGNLVMGTAGNKIIVPTGANASAGTSAAMSGTPGAVTVATTACSATAKVFYCRNVTGGTMGNVSITAQDGTGFTLTSDANETSTFNWWIINA